MFQIIFVENIKTHFTFRKVFFFLENRAVYEIMGKNTVEPGRPQMTIWCMRIEYWISKTANTHSEYAITYYFSTVKMVTRTHHSITLYVHSCLAIKSQMKNIALIVFVLQNLFTWNSGVTQRRFCSVGHEDFPLGFLNLSSTVITVRTIIKVFATDVYTDLAKF
jgi:hypothetical protein